MYFNRFYKIFGVLALAFGILFLSLAARSYAGSTPAVEIKDTQQNLRDQLQMMDVLDGALSSQESFAEIIQLGYRLATDDVVSVHVYNEDQLTGVYRIDAVGRIFMPLIGQVDAMSKTASELSIEIEKKLKDGYLNQPSVSVEISAFRPFYLLGEVRTPGHYSYVYGLSVIKAVAIAGGYTYRANQKKIMIEREFSGGKRHIEAQGATLIYPGDIVTVRERFF